MASRHMAARWTVQDRWLPAACSTSAQVMDSTAECRETYSWLSRLKGADPLCHDFSPWPNRPQVYVSSQNPAHRTPICTTNSESLSQRAMTVGVQYAELCRSCGVD